MSILLPLHGAHSHANYIPSAQLRLHWALKAFGPLARGLYPHLADGVLGFHEKLVQAVKEGVAWPYQPKLSADPLSGCSLAADPTLFPSDYDHEKIPTGRPATDSTTVL